jgi:hypothetical protein
MFKSVSRLSPTDMRFMSPFREMLPYNLKIVHDCLILLHPTSSFTIILEYVIEFYIASAVNIRFSNNQISKLTLLFTVGYHDIVCC